MLDEYHHINTSVECFMKEQQSTIMASSIKEFVLTDDHIKNIIYNDGTYVYFGYGLSDDDKLKLRDIHVRALLSNHHHVDTQKVTFISLTYCKGITDDSLVFIADNFPQLKKLWVLGCDLITDKGIIAVTEKCHKLTHLSYSFCSKVTNAALEAIVSNLPQLEKLDAMNCNISVIPDDFGDKLKQLKVLNLQHNKIKTLPASITNLVGTCTDFRIDGNPLQDPPLGVAQQGIETVNSIDMIQTDTCHKRERRFMWWIPVALLIISFFAATICGLNFAIQQQLVANSLDPAKQFYAIESNCTIVEVDHIVNGRQKRRKRLRSYTNIGCDDVYLYHFSLPRQHIEGTNTSIVEVESELESEESEMRVYQSMEGACYREEGGV